MKRWMLVLALLSGCSSKPYQRFVPVGDGALALDTKTGQQCWAIPKATEGDQVQNSHGIYCVDLYRDSN